MSVGRSYEKKAALWPWVVAPISMAATGQSEKNITKNNYDTGLRW